MDNSFSQHPEEFMHLFQEDFSHQYINLDNPDYKVLTAQAIKLFGNEIKCVESPFTVYLSPKGLMVTVRLDDRDDEEFEDTIGRVWQHIVIPVNQTQDQEIATGKISFIVTPGLKTWLCRDLDYPQGMWKQNQDDRTITLIKDDEYTQS